MKFIFLQSAFATRLIRPLASFDCRFCPFVGRTKAALSNHLRTHGVVTPFKPEDKSIKRRRRPTNQTKLKVLAELTHYWLVNGKDFPRVHFDRQCGFASSSISLWLKCPRLRQVSELPWLQCFRRLRCTVIEERSQFQAEHEELYMRFIYKRKVRGQEVGGQWFVDEMNAIMAQSPSRTAWLKCSHGWLQKYLKRYHISCQQQTEKQGMANTLRVSMLQAFHQEVCIIQQSKGLNPPDPLFGRFPPWATFNIDQIPAYFIFTKRRSYNPVGEACWVLNQGPSGTDKRMATIILTLRAEGEQIVKPFILFRGMGHLTPEFIAQLDAEGIPYAFNAKAWANAESCVEHLRYFHAVLKEKAPELKECMLLLDGLSSQSSHRFIRLALDLNILPVYFPPNCTHLVQPVDHRIAAWLKKAMHQLYLAEESLMHDQWAHHRTNGSMCPQYKRKTLLKWVSFCWEALKTMPDFITKAFTSTGCLITLKGAHAMQFLDIKNYSFQYPKQDL